MHWMHHHTLILNTHHLGSTAVGRCSCIWKSTKAATTVESHSHGHSHSLQIHLLNWVDLLIEHIVYTDLRLPPWLLWCHWQVVWLIHRELILLFLLVPVAFHIRVFHNFVHLDFVAHARWRLRILHVVHCEILVLVDVVLAASWGCASWIRVDASDSLVVRAALSRPPRRCFRKGSVLFDISHRLFLRDAYTTSFPHSFISFQRTLSIYGRQQRIVVTMSHIDIVIVIDIIILFMRLFLRYFRILLVWSTLGQIIVILHVGAGHVCAVLLVLMQWVTGLVQVHQATVVLFHDLLLGAVDFWIWMILVHVGVIFCIVLVVSVTSSGCFNSTLAVLAERSLIHEVEFCICLGSLSLLEMLGRQDSLVTVEKASWVLIREGDIDAWVITSIIWIFGSEGVEPVVFDGHAGCYSLVWVHSQQLWHEVNLGLVHDGCIAGFNRFWMRNVRKFETLIPCISAEFFMQKIRKWPENFLYNEELINFRITRKQRLSVHQLAHNAANSPNIDFLSIRKILRYKQKLRRPIPSRRYVVRQLRALTTRIFFSSIWTLVAGWLNPIIPVFQINMPCKSKVANFELVSLWRDQ